MKTEEIPTRQQIIEYYSSDFVSSQIVKNSKNREVAAAFPDGRYDKRPNIIQYQSDVQYLAKKGITSFHLSVERWSNPMGILPENYDKLRIGWDFVIDIDSKTGIEESKEAAVLIINLLKKYEIKNYKIKFSGRRGFHIVLPWEMFPKEMDYKPLSVRYPEVPRLLASFIREEIAEDLLNVLAKSRNENIRDLFSTVEDINQINPFSFVEVEKDWGNRHMFRAPFSLNEKTWLVSIPVENIESFTKESAKMENAMKIKCGDFFYAEENEASDLLIEAIDRYAAQKKEEPIKKNIIQIERKIGEEYFPPCIKKALEGLSDGRKRTIFTLMNFLKMMNWTSEEMEKKIMEWNFKNKPQLPNSIVMSQLRYNERRDAIPPANCESGMYYTDIGLCNPDNICKGNGEKITVKNPINYPFRKIKNIKEKLQKKGKTAKRGFSCICGKEFKTMRALEQHKGRSH